MRVLACGEAELGGGIKFPFEINVWTWEFMIVVKTLYRHERSVIGRYDWVLFGLSLFL